VVPEVWAFSSCCADFRQCLQLRYRDAYFLVPILKGQSIPDNARTEAGISCPVTMD
jgi:hypothetical protein